MPYPQDRLKAEDVQAGKLSKTFLDYIRQTVDDTSWAEIAVLIAAKTSLSKVLKAIRFAQYEPVPELEITYRIAMNIASKYTAGQLGINVRMDLLSMNQKSLQWLEKFGAEEVRYIGDTQKEVIRGILSQGYKEGWSFRNQGNYIKQFIGLDANRAEVLQNYGNSLMEQGIPEGKAWRMIEERGQELLQDRAEKIALNETLKASQQGFYDTTEQMVKRGIIDPNEYVGTWVAIIDDRTCDDCLAANGSIRQLPDGIYEASGTEFPELHIGDRCVERIERR